jgi:hypothetical protein
MKIIFYFADALKPLHQAGAAIIKEVENTNFSHFAIGLEKDGTEIVYEAVFPKSRKIEKSDWRKDYRPIRSMNFEVPLDKQYYVGEFLEENVGKWYSFDQCVWIAIITWFRIKKAFSDKVVLNGTKHLICTELGYLFSKEFFEGEYNASSDRIGLNDMYTMTVNIAKFGRWK